MAIQRRIIPAEIKKVFGKLHCLNWEKQTPTPCREPGKASVCLRVKQKEPWTLVLLSYSPGKCCQLHADFVESLYKRCFFGLGEGCGLAVY